VKNVFFCSIWTKIGMCIKRLVKTPHTKFHEDFSVGIALSREVRRTDGRTSRGKSSLSVTAVPTRLKMNLLASCRREVRQRVRKKNKIWDWKVVSSTVTIRPSDILYTEHKYHEELSIPQCLSHWIWTFWTQPETTFLSRTASGRVLSAPLIQESNKVTEMGGIMTCMHPKNAYKKKTRNFIR
jgi:hypothetical protein